MAAIITKDLVKEYPNGTGIRAISLHVDQGEVVGLTGAPGSGKSTLLSLLATRSPATRGSLTILGHRVTAGKERLSALGAIRRQLGVLLEDAPVSGELSGWENAWLLGRLAGVGPADLRTRLGILFDWAGLAEQSHRAARSYTYPMRRKLGLITALVHDPPVLLLDEPFHALDSPAKCALQGVLIHAHQRGTTVVVASTDVNQLRPICTRIVLLDSGRAVDDALPGEPLRQQASDCPTVIVRLARPSSVSHVRQVPGVLGTALVSPTELHARVRDTDTVLPGLLGSIVAVGGSILGVEICSGGGKRL